MIRVEAVGRPIKGGLYGIYRASGPELIDLADGLLDEVEPWAMNAVRDARDMVLAEMKRLLTLRSGGKSVENQPPTRRTGDLVRSLRKTAVTVRGRVVQAGITSTHEGVHRLEYGFVDRTGHHTLPHPWIRPAFENMREAIMRRFEAM